MSPVSPPVARAPQSGGSVPPLQAVGARLAGYPQPLEIDLCGEDVTLAGRPLAPPVEWDVPVTGTVYGVALNLRATLDVLGAALHAAPYQAPPRAPVLYIKPRNTLLAHRRAVRMPADVSEVALGPTLGVVIGATATRVGRPEAHRYIAGYTLVNDLAVPHDSYYRPAIRQQCRDGFCPIGPVIVPARGLSDPGALTIRAYVNGELRLEASFADLVRPIDVLLHEVSAFMTLSPGDVLTVGLPANLPRARAGDTIAIEAEGLGRLENALVAAP